MILWGFFLGATFSHFHIFAFSHFDSSQCCFIPSLSLSLSFLLSLCLSASFELLAMYGKQIYWQIGSSEFSFHFHSLLLLDCRQRLFLFLCTCVCVCEKHLSVFLTAWFFLFMLFLLIENNLVPLYVCLLCCVLCCVCCIGE